MANNHLAWQSRPPDRFIKTLVWLAGWLLAGVALAFIWLATPVTLLYLLPGPPENNLGLLNGETTIQRTGLASLPSKGLFSVAPGAEIRVTAFSYRPVTLNVALQAGQGSLAIAVNGFIIGALDRENLAGTYSFRFIPHRLDNPLPELHITLTRPSGASPITVSRLDLDFNEQWQPWRSSKSDFKIIMLAGLLTFVGFTAGPGRRISWLSWIALAGGLAGEVLLATWLGSLLQVGAGGALDAAVFWGGLGSVFYLMAFIFWVAIGILPVKNGYPIFAIVQPTLQSFQAKRPVLRAAMVLGAANAFLTFLLFLVPVIQNNGFDTLARYWDGPEYLAVAYSMYDPASLVLHIPYFSQFSPLYWGAHFPLVPLAIRLFSPLFGYTGAMFVLNYLFTWGFAVALYRLLGDFGYSKRPLWLTFVALFLPLRWLIYHSVGGSEPAALFFSILCLYQFKKEHYWWAGLWGFFVALARPNGFFLGIGLALWLIWQALEQFRTGPPTPWNSRMLILFAERFNWKALRAILPMGAAVLAVFALYGWQTGDFLAYLHIPEDVKHLYPLPFLSLDINVGRGEGDFYYYGLEAVGLALLWKEKRFELFWVGLALALPAFFILHDDVLRYSLPAFPFVFVIPFAAFLESRPARWLAAPALVAVLVYSWSQLGSNQMDLASWQELLKFIG
jgi:hypothetical protein